MHNKAIIAAAGSRKTEFVVESALASTSRVLICTYTVSNQNELTGRIENKNGIVPPRIEIMGWYGFLIQHGIHPYQTIMTAEPYALKGMKFYGDPPRYIKHSQIGAYVDSRGDIYRDRVAKLVVLLNEKTNGAVVQRLESIYDRLYIDEVQDLVGSDLDVLELLMSSTIEVVLVGDPRQATLATNRSQKNKRFKKRGILDWFNDSIEDCTIEEKVECYRSVQPICDFADSLYPDMTKTVSMVKTEIDHQGVFVVGKKDVHNYMSQFENVTVLRDRVDMNTDGLPAVNIGIAKGATYERVMIYPTKPMLRFLVDGDCTKLKAPERLYVAVTRARYSSVFVVPDGFQCLLKYYHD